MPRFYTNICFDSWIRSEYFTLCTPCAEISENQTFVLKILASLRFCIENVFLQRRHRINKDAIPGVFIMIARPRKCRMPLSSEPAKAGWTPTRKFRLGRSLSRTCREMEARSEGVGPEPVGRQHVHSRAFFLYHKS